MVRIRFSRPTGWEWIATSGEAAQDRQERVLPSYGMGVDCNCADTLGHVAMAVLPSYGMGVDCNKGASGVVHPLLVLPSYGMGVDCNTVATPCDFEIDGSPVLRDGSGLQLVDSVLSARHLGFSRPTGWEWIAAARRCSGRCPRAGSPVLRDGSGLQQPEVAPPHRQAPFSRPTRWEWIATITAGRSR